MKKKSKYHILSDGQSTSLASKITSANRHDVTQALALVDFIQHILSKPSRPRFSTRILKGDRAYDSKALRLEFIKRGIIPKIPKRYLSNMSGLGSNAGGKRTLSKIHQYRRIRTRYEKRLYIHQAFLTIEFCIFCFKN